MGQAPARVGPQRWRASQPPSHTTTRSGAPTTRASPRLAGVRRRRQAARRRPRVAPSCAGTWTARRSGRPPARPSAAGPVSARATRAPAGSSAGAMAQTVALHRDPLGVLRRARARHGELFTLRLATVRPIVVVATPRHMEAVPSTGVGPARAPVTAAARWRPLPRSSRRRPAASAPWASRPCFTVGSRGLTARAWAVGAAARSVGGLLELPRGPTEPGWVTVASVSPGGRGRSIPSRADARTAALARRSGGRFRRGASSRAPP
ncbi:MAG: hypothetical protein QOJ63_1482 [Solirubrobacteraceae bacterium]|nr:hypothetical protein [Solirubrobacteraceae bacterium]